MFGHEYGWTPEYCLYQLTQDQVEALLGAIKRRYRKQANALKSGGETPTDSLKFDDKALPSVLADFDIEVMN